MSQKTVCLLAACLFAGALASGCSLFNKNSEQIVTIKAGPSWTHSTDVKHAADNGAVTDFLFIAKDVKFDTGVAAGLGLELWSGSLPNFGVGFEVEHFTARSPKQTTVECDFFPGLGGGCARGASPFVSQHYNATAFEFPLRARYGFASSNAFPNGQYQLFALLGPAIFLSRYFDAGMHFTPGHQSDTDTTVGVTTGVGLRYMVTPNIDLSMEYRFKYFSPRFNVTESGDPTRIKLNIASSQLLFGVSYHFNLFGRQ